MRVHDTLKSLRDAIILMPVRYTILEHDWPHLHWDLLIEAGEQLRTWRLDEPPREGGAIPAEETFPHRRIYLDYEGPVSGDRGTVRQWDTGTFEPIEFSSRRVVVDVLGSRLAGRLSLTPGPDANWNLIYCTSSEVIGSPADVSD